MSKITEYSNWLDKFNSLKLDKYGKDFLRTWDKDMDSIKATQMLAELLRELYYKNVSAKVFDSGLAISIFRDKSTRTKYSYASGTNNLGLQVELLDEDKSQISHGETVLETINMLSFLTRVIGIRDDKFLGVGHTYQQQVVDALEVGVKEGVLWGRPSVVNLQCDEDHPTQSLSDLSHLIKYFGGEDKLKGKKVVMSWAYSPSYGKPMSVAQGTIALLTRYGVNVTFAYPEGYNVIKGIEEKAQQYAIESGGSFEVVGDLAEAVKDADVVYPKSWAGFDVMAQRTELLKANDDKGLTELEKQTLEQNKKFVNWEYTADMQKTTKDGNALYMHCLPADISGDNVEHGEVQKSVFDQWRRETYIEASYKPFVISSMIMLTQFGTETLDKIKMILERDQKIG